MGTDGVQGNRGCRLILQVLMAVGIGVILSVFLKSGSTVVKAVTDITNVSDYVSGDWAYRLDEDGNATLIDYYGNEEEIVLADKINGYTVVGLQGTFYNNKNLRKIVIPDTVTYIERTFHSCSSLSEIVWSKNLIYIGDNTFYGCSALSEITIPDGVSHIGEWAFANCNFTGIELPASLVDISDYAFRECTELLEITFPDSLKTIGNYSFENCSSLWSIRFPDTLQSIGEQAFSYCHSLSKVRLPVALKEIDSTAFKTCTNLADIQLEEGNPYFQLDGGILYNAGKTEVIMAGSRTMRMARISEGVKIIHAYAFDHCKSIKQIVLPDSLEYIGDRAFYQIGIQSITIPGNVTEIGKEILFNCVDLQQLEVLGPIEDLNGICESCVSLTQVSLSEGIRIISGFSSCSSLQQISLPESTEIIDERAFTYSGIVSLLIPTRVVRIEEGSLAGTSLEKVSVAEGNAHFYTRQEGLYNAEHTFLAVTAANGTVSVSEGCVRIGEMAFYEQSTVSRVEIPDTVTEIGDQAFARCGNLTEICVGNQLKRIGSGAFWDTPFWTEKAELEEGVYYLDSYAVSIDSASKGEVLKLREGCTLVADSFSTVNDVLKYLWLPDSLQYIGRQAFWCDGALQEMIGGGSLKYIGEQAFYGNHGLERVLIRGKKVTIEKDAFNLSSMHLSELMIDAEEVVLAENCFGGGNDGDKNGISISTLVLPNLNIPLRKTGLAYISSAKTKLLLSNMSAQALNQSETLFSDCEGLQLYFPFSSSEFTGEDILSGQGVSVSYQDEWHLCRFIVHGAMKQLSILSDGDAVIPPTIEEEGYLVTPEGPLLENICWDLDGDGTADILPETIYEDIKAEALYNIREEKHSWMIKEVLQQQNCTQGGDVIYYCTGCGKEKQVQTKALGHDFSVEWTVDREASCTEMGEKSHHCTREGCTERTAVTPVIAMGHIWDAGIVTIEPQIGVEGEMTYTCTVCGEQRRETMAALPEQTATPEPSLPAESMIPDGSEKTQQSESTGESAMPEDSAKPEESRMPDPPQDTKEPAITQVTVSGFRAKSNYNKITLYWKRNNAGEQYWLYRSEKRNGRKKLMKKLTGNQVSYSDNRVAAGKTYYYQIEVMWWDGSTMKLCGSSPLCKAALKIRKAPTVQIVKKRRGKIRYLEITIKKYTGKRLEIFYRKRKKGAYRKLKLRSDSITKYKKFRVRYLSNTGNLFFRFRTYRKRGKIKIYSRYTAEKKILVAEKNK